MLIQVEYLPKAGLIREIESISSEYVMEEVF